MMECLAHFVLTEHLAAASFDPPLDDTEGRAGYERVTTESRRIHKTKDAHIAVLPYTTGHWQRFFRLIGRDDMAAEAWLADASRRSERVAELYDIVGAVMPTRTTAEWVEALHGIDIPASAINDLDDLLTDPQLTASGLFQHYTHPTEGNLRGLASPVRYSGFQAAPAAAPRLGGDTRAVLSELGYGEADITAMAETGAIICA